jgi:hypothetical protein
MMFAKRQVLFRTYLRVNQILRFLTNFEASYLIYRLILKNTHKALLQIVSSFQIFYQKSVCMMLNWLLFFGVKNVPKFQHFAPLVRKVKQMWPSVDMI